MAFAEEVFVGINTTGGHKPFQYAALDLDGRLLALGESDQDELLAFLLGKEKAWVAINAPQRPNQGVVRRQMEATVQGRQIRGADLRLAEQELHARGIPVSKTPGHLSFCPAWMRFGFALYQKLESAGFRFYPAKDAPLVMLETHPHAVFCALLEKQPLPRSTLEGRMQRQLLLVDAGLKIRDPMDFFEEVTRYRVLKGDLPFDWIYDVETLDTLAAALTAWRLFYEPEQVVALGDPSEGQIVLPVASLQTSYD